MLRVGGMNTSDLLNELARNARYPAIPRVRVVTGHAVGPWILLGTYRDRAAAQEAVTTYLQAHQGQTFQPSILEFSHPEYPATLMQLRQRRTRSRSQRSRSRR